MAKDRRPHRRPASLVPEELARITFPCPSCGAASTPEWYKTLVFPAEPLPHNTEPGHFVKIDFPVSCPAGHEFTALAPEAPHNGRIPIYADDFQRHIHGHESRISTRSLKLFGFAAVYLGTDFLPAFTAKLHAIKSEFDPDKAPDTWPLHMTEVWGAEVGKAKKVALAHSVAELVRNSRPQLWSAFIGGVTQPSTDPRQRRRELKVQREDTLSLVLMSTIQRLRDQGFSPSWTFDRFRDARAGTIDEGWARELFLGWQYTPLATWMAKRAPIFPPTFVEPGSHPLLEIADFLAYTLGREFELWATGRENELPSTKALGTSFYQFFDGRGDVDAAIADALPISRFWPLTYDQ